MGSIFTKSVHTILLPAPGSSYRLTDFVSDNIVWIPTIPATGNSAVEVDDDRERFPSLLFTAPFSVPYTLLYFHGNSCDLGNMYNELRLLSEELNANVLGI
eukprot:GHVU01026441.1.p1 GENE.GHVU01026441.1~~GHVU01026441.1.p1  ORF type:complete len:101 (+),score=4.95 GHVU01026441.1:172-474(+)